MALHVHYGLPASEKIKNLGTFAEKLAPDSGNIRIGLVNLMPLKEMTEEDFIHLLSDTPRNVDIELITMASHTSRNTPLDHITAHYSSWPDIERRHYDGMIITGAPVEKIEFESVDYWIELTSMFDSLRRRTIPTLYICWAAFAGLYHNYGITKHILDRKISGVFHHRIHNREKPIFEGIGDDFYIPHSRYATFRHEEIANHPALTIESESDESGVYIVEAAGGKELYITGHSEYALDTLDFEYHRDLKKGIDPHIPANYYRDDNPELEPIDRWSRNARRLFGNWLNSL